MDRFIATLFAASLAIVLAACGSSTQTVTAPTTTKCAVTATADTASFAAGGGSGNITVSTNRECQWTAQSSTSWVAIASGSSGQGDGKVSFKVSENGDPSTRRTTVNVNDQQVAISQEAAPCQFTVSPLADTVSPGGDRRSVAVTTNSPQCAWTAKSNTDWITIASGAQGTGNGTVTYDAPPTTGPPRSGSLTVAGRTVTIGQGTGCSVAIGPTGQAVGASGGGGSLSVTAGPGCTWTATTSVPWITITSGTTGAGSGTVVFNVTAWNGPGRAGTITVNEQVFTITQGGGCSFSLSTSSMSIGSGGGPGSAQVITADGCSWSASSNASWISITAGASGSGNGTVQFSVAATTGPDRTGTLSIGGKVFTINQSGGCSFSINPTSQSVDSGGGSGSIAVSAGGGCGWTSSVSQSWVHITAGSNGTGNGTVQFTVDANAGAARDASITVAGSTFTIHQNAGCSYSLSPTSAGVGSAGGTGSVAVATGGNCTWSAVAPDAWARITSGGSGTGNGTVQFTVDANSGAARSSTLTIAGIPFTISQDAAPPAPCTYSISPTGADYADAAAHSGSFALTASQPDCAWTATPSDAWIQLTSAASGTGSTTIIYSAAANDGPTRTGTISVGGQTFTIAQASGCTVSIAPASQSVDAAGGGGTIALTSGGGCGWTAAADVDWITITGGASGTGSGTVTFTVAANPGAARTGHINVGGQAFTVLQGGTGGNLP